MARLTIIALFLLLLTLVSAKAQTVVYQGTTTTLEVRQVQGNTYEWELYSDPTVDFAKVQGNCPASSANFISGNTGASVNVLWLLPGIYFYKVTAHDAAHCTLNLKVGMLKVIPGSVSVGISGATFIGACQQIRLNTSAPTGNVVKYEWSLIDQGGSLTSQTGTSTEFYLSPSYSGTLPANFRVRLKVTDRDGNSNSDTIRIKVDRLPVAEVYSVGQVQKDGSMIVDGTLSSGTAINYKWSTTEGKIIGPDNNPTATVQGPGNYNLDVIDIYGCKSSKTFRFPIELLQIKANPDYARTSWAQDTTINVLSNDISTVNLLPGTVRVTEPPVHGNTRVNPDGTITYIPVGRTSGRDQFVYEVCDAASKCSSATVTIDIYDAGLKIPEAFSPNGDGLNDRLVFMGLEHYPQTHMHVYTRSGQLVYQSDDYQNDWDGRMLSPARAGLTNNERVPAGTYYYILELGGTSRIVKGFIYIAY